MVDLTPVNFLDGLGGLANLPRPFDDQQRAIQAGQLNQQGENTLAQQAQALQGVQAKALESAQFGRDVQTYLANPTPQGAIALTLNHPEQSAAIKQAHDLDDENTKQTNLRQLGGVYSYLTNGKPELAAKQLQDRIDAEKTAGLSTDDDQQILSLISSGDPEDLAKAQGITGMHLAAVLGPDKYGEMLTKLGVDHSPDKGFTLNQGEVRFDGSGHEIARAAPKRPDPYHYTLKDANGVEHEFVDYGDGAPQPTGNNSTTGGVGGTLPTSLPGIVDRIARIEGTGQNPNSSSLGVGQFTNGTWLDTYKKANPNSGMTDAQILAQRTNPTIARQMLGNLVQSNAQTLQAGGIAPTADNIYVANFLGPSGAIKALTASPDTPISQIATPKQIAANPTTLGKFQNVGQLRQWAAGKMATGATNSGASSTPGQPSQGGPRQLDSTPFAQAPARGDLGLTGQPFLTTLPTGQAALIKAIVDGRAPAPRPGSKYGEALLEKVAQYDPTIDTTTLPVRQQVRKDFTGNGKAAVVISSLNRFASHLNSAWDNHLALGGPNLGPLSGVAASAVQSFDPAHVKAYNQEIEALQGEFQKLTKNGVGSESEAERLIANAKAAQSSAGRGAALQAMAKLAMAQIDPIHQQWASAFGDRPLPVDITNGSRAVISNILSGGKSALPVDHNGSPYTPKSAPVGNASPPVGALQLLRSNPGLAAQFDQKYGLGAAAKALGR